MVCAPVRSIIPELKLGDYLSVQAHKPCFISHLNKEKKKHSNRPISVISEGCVGLTIICAAMVFTTRRTMETVKITVLVYAAAASSPTVNFRIFLKCTTRQ